MPSNRCLRWIEKINKQLRLVEKEKGLAKGLVNRARDDLKDYGDRNGDRTYLFEHLSISHATAKRWLINTPGGGRGWKP